MRAFLFVLAMLIGNSAQADIILVEDFEDASISYTASAADDLADIFGLNYFGRIANDTALPPLDLLYGNAQGTGFFGAQNTDDAPGGGASQVSLSWNGIDVSNFENLNLSWFVAEDDSASESWDSSSSFRIEYQLDGGGFQNLFAIASEIGIDLNQEDEKPRVDTNFDGVGDGAEITDVFAQFSSVIANGSSLDIRVTIEGLDETEEDIAFDNLMLTGDLVGVPEPAALSLFALGLVGLITNRRWRSE